MTDKILHRKAFVYYGPALENTGHYQGKMHDNPVFGASCGIQDHYNTV
ncbi:MAG: hypothetical protein JW864_03815 [Spirochaetes bacterium]|nr:hypothetical protein [Spirochaetota bacterium]